MAAENPSNMEQENVRLSEKNRELLEALELRDNQFQEVSSRLESVQRGFATTGMERRLLLGIAEHDFMNQIARLRAYIGLSKTKTSDPEVKRFIEEEDKAVRVLEGVMKFMKDHADIGSRPPFWHNIGTEARALSRLYPDLTFEVSPALDRFEIFADPLLGMVFRNLTDYSQHYGERVRHISFSAVPHDADHFAVVYEDDGVGIPENDKETIFRRDFHDYTGPDRSRLFLSRRILAFTGITLRETGEAGKGARFEMLIPGGAFRFTGAAGSASGGRGVSGELSSQGDHEKSESGSLSVKNRELTQKVFWQQERIAHLQMELTAILQRAQSLGNHVAKTEKDRAAWETECADNEREILLLNGEITDLRESNEVLIQRMDEWANVAVTGSSHPEGLAENTEAPSYLQEELWLDACLKERKRFNRILVIALRISDNLTVIRGYLDMIKKSSRDPKIEKLIEHGERAGNEIYHQLQDLQYSKIIGAMRPRWQNISRCIRKTVADKRLHTEIPVVIDCPDDLEVRADGSFKGIFSTLFDLSIREGKNVTEVHVTSRVDGRNLVLIWEDNGEGVKVADKERIFAYRSMRGHHPTLFFVREILAVTDITIRETGTAVTGTRFELTVPEGMYRFTSYEDSAPESTRHPSGMETGQDRVTGPREGVSSEQQDVQILQEKIAQLEGDLKNRDKTLAEREEEIIRLQNTRDMLSVTNEILRRRFGDGIYEPESVSASDREKAENTRGADEGNEESRLQEELRRSKEAHEKVNKRLHFDLSIIRHDILNLNTALRGFIELAESSGDPDLIATCLKKMEGISDSIHKQLMFSREYENLAIQQPVWQNIGAIVGKNVASGILGKTQVMMDCPPNLEILADPLLVKVFANLLDNSLRYGQRETEIRTSSYNEGDDLVVVWEDNGVGIAPGRKEEIFARQKPVRGGFTLAHSRIVLETTGISVRETGIFGEGARFEMSVPKGAYRFTG